jgi:ankyrin repeat protein
MKKLLFVLLAFFSLAARAQQNTLLDQSFWQNAPDINSVKAEVAKGNNPAQLNAMSMDPVVMAINAQAPTEIIKYLLDQPGNDPNKLTHDGRTYMHWAANRGNADVLEYLITKGGKINIEDSHGTTPLTFAASSGQQNTRVYDILAANGASLKKDVNQDGANVLLLAISNDKDLKLTNYFISKGLDIKSTDTNGNNAFSYAAKSGNIDLMKNLIEKGVPVTANAMLMAAQGGGGRRGPGSGGGIGLPVYQYLESVGAKPTAISKTGENVLHYIVRKPNQGDVISYFIEKGVNVNQVDDDGNTVLMNAAAGSRDTALIGLLLTHVKNINQQNQKGLSALTMAVKSNSPQMVSFLIGKGADVRVLDKSGNNLAYYLVESYGTGGERQFNGPKPEDFDTKMKLLQDKGLDVKTQQRNGNTLYHLAVAKNNISLLQRLQPLNIDVNSKNKEGVTALHKAALIAKDDAILKYLISIGAKKDIGTSFNETAFDLASENETLSKNHVSVTFLK